MLVESIGGECPCCNYDKMLQRHGSSEYYLLDGCPNCGFGYGTNHHDLHNFGIDAWIDYGRHVLASIFSHSIDGEFYLVDDSKFEHDDIRYYLLNNDLKKLDKDVLRKRIFDWMETQDIKSDSITVFRYNRVDVERWLSTNPMIFKKID